MAKRRKKRNKGRRPGGSGASAKGGGASAKGGGASAKAGGASAKAGGASAKASGPSPKGGGPSPKGGGPSPKGGGASAKGGGPSPKGGGPSPRGGAASARSAGAAPSTDPARAKRSGSPSPEASLDRLPLRLLLVILFLFGAAGACVVSIFTPPAVGGVVPATGALSTPGVLGLLGAAFAVAGGGLALKRGWGWWLASVLALANIFLNLLSAILANTGTTVAGVDPDLLVLAATVRLALWTAVGLWLQGYRVVTLFGLSWDREQERQRTHHVLTGALVLTVAAWLL